MLCFKTTWTEVHRLTVFIFTLLAISGLTVGSLTLSGQVVNINDIPYYVPAAPVSFVRPSLLNRLHGAGGLVPATVVDASSAAISATITKYGQVDDVWNEGFLEGML